MRDRPDGAVPALRRRGALCLTFWMLSGMAAFEPRALARGGDSELPPGASEHDPHREPPIQVYAGPHLLAGGRSGGDFPEELGSGLGFQFGAVQFWKWLGIGAELRFAWLEAFASDPSPRSVEVLLKPSLGFALEQLPMRLYVAVPFGLSMALVPRAAGPAGPISRDGVLGPALGATGFLSQRFALNAEAGYQWIAPRGHPLLRRELVLALNLVYGL